MKLLLLRILAILGFVLLVGAIYGFLNVENCEILTGCGYTTLCDGASLDINDYDTACTGVKPFVPIGLLVASLIMITTTVFLSTKKK